LPGLEKAGFLRWTYPEGFNLIHLGVIEFKVFLTVIRLEFRGEALAGQGHFFGGGLRHRGPGVQLGKLHRGLGKGHLVDPPRFAVDLHLDPLAGAGFDLHLFAHRHLTQRFAAEAGGFEEVGVGALHFQGFRQGRGHRQQEDGQAGQEKLPSFLGKALWVGHLFLPPA
jgi:hypothetical protein